MSEQQNRAGQRLGNYRLERLLGRGGFAEVYLGYHLRLQRQAAIKVLHAYLSEKETEMFQQEAQIIAALDHPNIVRILDFDVQNGIPFLVMDYLPHGTLRQHHPQGKRVALPTIVSHVRQVADALQYAHDQRLIHRDVKPENMLIGRRNEVVLSDFGIAAIAHSTSSMTAQASVGTIHYMAPEQIQAHARTASDQYALGVVVYEWLGGERPFNGSFTEIFAKHLMTPPPPLRKILPDLPIEVEQVVLTALAKDPNQRFNNIQAFATTLEEASRATKSPPDIVIAEKALVQPPSSLPLSSTLFSPPLVPEPTDLSTPPAERLPPTVAASPPPSTTTVTPLPIPASSPKAVSRRRISRRAVMISLATVGVVAAGGGIAWWVISPHPLYTYHGHAGGVRAVAWAPDGQSIASGGEDNTIQVWDAANGGDVFTYHASDGASSVAWSPDGKRIVSGGKTVQVWDAANGGNVYTYRGHSDWVNAVVWSPDGKRIASGSGDKTVQVWDAVNGGNVYTYRGHSTRVNGVVWSPDGTRIASASGDDSDRSDHTVQVWDVTEGKNILTYQGHSAAVFAVAWSPDGKHIASAGADTTVQVWNATDGSKVYTYRGHSPGGVSAVTWSPNSKRIASTGGGYANPTVQVWDAIGGGNGYTYHESSSYVFFGADAGFYASAVAWSPDGKRIVSASGDRGGMVQIWEAK